MEITVVAKNMLFITAAWFPVGAAFLWRYHSQNGLEAGHYAVRFGHVLRVDGNHEQVFEGQAGTDAAARLSGVIEATRFFMYYLNDGVLFCLYKIKLAPLLTATAMLSSPD
jgi:hypothetical protein